MATRRTNANPTTNPPITTTSTTTPTPRPKPLSSPTATVVPSHVIIKLLLFTFAMIVLPLTSYFLSAATIFSGNTTYAGATAAIVANIVLLAYVFVAISEDKADDGSDVVGGVREVKKEK
ncbi:hypothetical protein DFH27DRAFT_256114 [Peziza echinospora]|nr:hypothetical protein DFH27DRAFT_256114 [Peziza echinospora]